MPRQMLAYGRFVRLRMVSQEILERHKNPRGAEAALQRMMTAECLLEHGKFAELGGESFDSAQTCAFDLHGERETSARRHPIDLHGAGAAHAVLAPNVGAGHAEDMPHEVA